MARSSLFSNEHSTTAQSNPLSRTFSSTGSFSFSLGLYADPCDDDDDDDDEEEEEEEEDNDDEEEVIFSLPEVVGMAAVSAGGVVQNSCADPNSNRGLPSNQGCVHLCISHVALTLQPEPLFFLIVP